MYIYKHIQHERNIPMNNVDIILTAGNMSLMYSYEFVNSCHVPDDMADIRTYIGEGYPSYSSECA